MRKSLLLLATSTALVGVAGLARAADPTVSANGLYIDVGTNGSSNSLVIAQDSSNTHNVISGDGTPTGSAFAVKGAWDSLSVTQTGTASKSGSNILKGAGIAALGGPTGNTVLASYTTTNNADNVHSLTIAGNGTSTGPASAALSITMVNNGATAGANDNTVTDAFTTAGALAYTLNVNGNTNAITNAISAGAIALTQTVTGNGNTVRNQQDSTHPTAAFASNGAVTETINIASADNNTISNYAASAGGDRTVSVTLYTGSNTVTNTFDASSGTEEADLTVNAGSKVAYTYSATPGSGTTYANTTLNGVIGASGAAAPVIVNQSAGGTSSTLVISGGSTPYTMGTGVGPSGAYGASVSQASAGATSNVTFTAGGNGYTVAISQ